MSDGWGAPPPAENESWGSAAPASTPATTQAPPSQEDYLNNDSVKSFSFDGPVGTFVDGIVTSVKVVQQIDYDTRQPKFWGNGDPCWTLRVHLQTGAHESTEDDGVRSLFVDYKKKDALDAAFKKAEVKPVVAEGARIRMAFVAGGPKENKRDPRQPKYKLYEASYAPPGSPAAVALAQQFASGSTPAPPAPAPAPPAQDEPPF